MPLDGRNWKQDTETKPDLSKPSLEGLSWLLRHMPADHEWDFAVVGGKTKCGSAGCAFGLAQAVWPDWGGDDKVWNAPPSKIHRFFMHRQYSVPDHLVTPTMVADRIDSYLAETRK